MTVEVRISNKLTASVILHYALGTWLYDCCHTQLNIKRLCSSARRSSSDATGEYHFLHLCATYFISIMYELILRMFSRCKSSKIGHIFFNYVVSWQRSCTIMDVALRTTNPNFCKFVSTVVPSHLWPRSHVMHLFLNGVVVFYKWLCTWNELNETCCMFSRRHAKCLK